jgi:hypothetical protein
LPTTAPSLAQKLQILKELFSVCHEVLLAKLAAFQDWQAQSTSTAPELQAMVTADLRLQLGHTSLGG